MTELEGLLAELGCGDDIRANAAAVRLPDFGADALEAVRSLLHSIDIDERWWAIRALVGFEITDQITQDFLAALDDDNDEIRQAAILAFCHHPNPQAVLPLARFLSDPNPMTSKLASNALILIGKPATHVLLEIVQTGSRSAQIEAARALAEIKDPLAIPGLLKIFETDSTLMQYWAGLGLENLGVGMLYLKPE